jgi:DNA repair protein RecN (Recombination protein N)
VLTELRIAGLGVIESADLEFAAGLTVVTGETGAGKTMVVNGLSLLLGDRADSGAVRSESARAVVEGRWQLPPGSPLLDRAADAGADVEGHELLAVRSVTAQGRSRAHLGGTSVPVGLLAELGRDLVSMHSQSDQIDLLRPRRQLEALDAYARTLPGSQHAKCQAAYVATYRELWSVQVEHDELVAAANTRAEERERLLFGLGEIEALDPQPGEDVALTEESARLGHADELRTAAGVATRAMSGDEYATDAGDDVLGLLGQARKVIAPMTAHDPRLADLAVRLDELAAVAGEVAADLAAYTESAEVDPARLAAVEERRAALGRLTRRYGGTVDAVLEWSRTSAQRVDALTGADERISELADRRTTLVGDLTDLAATLHTARLDAASRFADQASSELADLAMPSARVAFDVTTTPDPDGLVVDGEPLAFGPEGVDSCELLLAPHTGAPLRPLARGASGGELSRVMLACEVVLGADSTVPTFVFDEVDAGVGGAAAVEVGRRLARLATTGQVVVVTHLAQVAAFADRHLVVRKDDDGSFTRSGVTTVTGEDRIAELARMLGGDASSQVGLAHARELVEQASRTPSPATKRASAGTGSTKRARRSLA